MRTLDHDCPRRTAGVRTKHDATPALRLPGRGDEFRILRRRAAGFDPHDPATGRAGSSHIAPARAAIPWAPDRAHRIIPAAG
ncbi:hypothetical protein [Nocardia sp. CA-119907]|uniref:hypothetical protein n=1 Tax=Nocardia sp. CA-119907 TaxID=3239973 RepID=UPI003D953734